MKNFLRSALLLFAAIGVADVAASLSDYRCTVQRVEMADGASDAAKSNYAGYIGKAFTVDRRTGVMVGVLKNGYVNPPQVLDLGSTQNSYKVIGGLRLGQGAGVGSNIYALNILEYRETRLKPFVFLDNDVVFFGRCEHFK